MPPVPDDPPARPRPLPRGSVLFLLAAATVTLAGVAYLRATAGIEVVVTTRDLPAWHQIVETDLDTERRARSDVPGGAANNEDALIGRYTTGRRDKGQPLLESGLGPELPVRRLAGLVVTALPADAAQTVNGTVGRGDIVRLLLDPAGQGAPRRPVSVPEVLVLDVARSSSASPSPYVVTLALTPPQRPVYEGVGFVRWRLIVDKPFSRS